MKAKSDYDLCYQCGWLGLCVIACPLADPAKAVRPEQSTHPDVENATDEVFDIVIDTPDVSQFQVNRPPAPDAI